MSPGLDVTRRGATRRRAARPRPVVHLELHTGDLARASSFYAQLCGWRAEEIETAAGDVDAATDRARALGAAVLLGPREGPAGWRSVVATPAGGEIAFWQPKSRRAAEVS